MDEAVLICERILDDCVIDKIRYKAKETLSCIYSEFLYEPQKALAIVDSMPDMNLCSNVLRGNILKGNEKLLQSQENIEMMAEHLHFNILNVADADYTNGSDLPVRERIRLVEKTIKLFELIYDDGNLGFYEGRIAWSYRRIAALYLLENDYEKALDNLEKMAEHTIKYDMLPDKQNYTASLINKLVFDKNIYHTLVTHTESYRMLNDRLSQERYDVIRDTDRFKAVVYKLKQYAK